MNFKYIILKIYIYIFIMDLLTLVNNLNCDKTNYKKLINNKKKLKKYKFFLYILNINDINSNICIVKNFSLDILYKNDKNIYYKIMKYGKIIENNIEIKFIKNTLDKFNYLDIDSCYNIQYPVLQVMYNEIPVIKNLINLNNYIYNVHNNLKKFFILAKYRIILLKMLKKNYLKFKDLKYIDSIIDKINNLVTVDNSLYMKLKFLNIFQIDNSIFIKKLSKHIMFLFNKNDENTTDEDDSIEFKIFEKKINNIKNVIDEKDKLINNKDIVDVKYSFEIDIFEDIIINNKNITDENDSFEFDIFEDNIVNNKNITDEYDEKNFLKNMSEANNDINIKKIKNESNKYKILDNKNINEVIYNDMNIDTEKYINLIVTNTYKPKNISITDLYNIHIWKNNNKNLYDLVLNNYELYRDKLL